MNLLVTAGPTREFFDSVRFISNPSSGKMGYCIAAEAARRKHVVTLVSGPVALAEPENVLVVPVVSAQEMLDEVLSRLEHCDAIIMTAAVCDYRPIARLDRKLQKKNQSRTLELEPTEDILARLGVIRPRPILIGFAMEDHDHHAHAEAKLRRKRCDAIVLNDLANVGGDDGTIEVLRADRGWSAASTGTKTELASVVVSLAEELVQSRKK